MVPPFTLGVAQIPWDNQVRKLLDPLAPSALSRYDNATTGIDRIWQTGE